ncbi:hypothetical protein PsorP6_007251 [Peronosclerospora sorghi]|uniref:Uncharacterized protein n=1 Tax=Peronosclerospora sorghi TaxID=230839 RepID=A0ACC0W7U0_9STRA|nr:hypothetical protein PsorP6_007251 [Peronosclerospora sorghi]
MGFTKLGTLNLARKRIRKRLTFSSELQPLVADVWSLGILRFMLLTGAPLLEFASPASQEFKTVRAMGCRGVLKSSGMDSQLSAATMDLLSKMLEFDPTKRLQSMAQVLNHSALLGIYSTTMSMIDRAMYYQPFGTQDSLSRPATIYHHHLNLRPMLNIYFDCESIVHSRRCLHAR